MTDFYLNDQDRDQLLHLARQSITQRFSGKQSPPELSSFSPTLQEPGACFVTLRINQELRGCIGSLQSQRPLAQDVWENAQSAAFRDPRFPPLQKEELDRLVISISVLTPSEKFNATDEQDLLSKLRPGVDGLTISSGYRKATFLPAVWENLPEPDQFLFYLKQKAGIPTSEWPDDIQLERYRSVSFEESSL